MYIVAADRITNQSNDQSAIVRPSSVHADSEQSPLPRNTFGQHLGQRKVFEHGRQTRAARHPLRIHLQPHMATRNAGTR